MAEQEEPSLDEALESLAVALFEWSHEPPFSDDSHGMAEARQFARRVSEELIEAVRAEEREKAAQAPTDDERAEWRDEAIRRYPHAEVAKYMRQALQNAFIEGARFAARIRAQGGEQS